LNAGVSARQVMQAYRTGDQLAGSIHDVHALMECGVNNDQSAFQHSDQAPRLAPLVRRSIVNLKVIQIENETSLLDSSL
jgi:hypothetical protein